MTTPAERRTFPFQPTNRERPPSRSTHTSEEYVHIDLDGDASKFNYTPPFSSGIPTTPSKAKLKNYVFPPTTSETIDRLDYPAYGLEHPTDDLDGAMGSGRRPRGESDLGRPALRSRAPSITYGLAAIPSEYELDTPLIHKAPPNFENKYSLPEELLTSILIPLPYLLGSLVHLLTSSINHRKHSHRVEVAEEILEELASTALPVTTKNSGLFTACALASGTLLIVGLYGRLIQRQALDRRRSNSSASRESVSPLLGMFTWKYLKRVFSRMAAVGLPFLAMVEIGGVRTGLFLLAGAAEGLIAPDSRVEQIKLKSWRRILQSHRYLCGLFVLSLLADLFFLKTNNEPSSTIRGYLALVKPILLLQSPMPPTPAPSPHPTKPISPLISSRFESTTTLVAGIALASLTLTIASMLSHIPSFDVRAAVLFGASILTGTALLVLSRPASLRTLRKPGFALGLLLCGCFGLAIDSGSTLAVLAIIVLSTSLYFAVQMDTRAVLPFGNAAHTHLKSHSHGQHQHSQGHTEVNGSKFTQVLLRHTKDWPLMHSILSEKESRRITYFMVINLTFMFIQTFYSIVSGSLGLLSDSIHMLFDCVGLFAGLVAAVMSKWPPNLKFPYGYGKVEVLSGLGNGIFLMIISVEIIWESMERVAEGAELKRMNELLMVSVAGLLINLLGLQLTGHHHHHGGGGDCGHSHSHTHSHEKEPSTMNGDSTGSALNGTSLTGAENIGPPAHNGGHAGHHHHSHANENMAGIYLHILADTMGSVAVIVSTLLTQYTGWYGWDPLASFVIAVLIIAASIPLVVGSAKQLLLTMPSEMEYTLRTTLQGISELRGVSGYAVPRFWLDERHVKDDHTHDHDHDHASHEPHVNGLHKHHDHDSHAHHSHESHDHQNGAPKHSHSRSKSDPHAHTHTHSSMQLHVHEEEHTDYIHDHARNKSIYHTPSSSIDLKHDHTHHTHDHDTQDHDTHSPHKPSQINHSHTHSEPLHSSDTRLLGVIHVVAQPRANIEDVRKRVDAFLRGRGMDVLVHVEREGQSRCWCGGTTKSGHGRARSTVAMELYGQ